MYCQVAKEDLSSQKLDKKIIVYELQKRGYSARIVDDRKGIDSFVNVYADTKIEEKDLKLICSLPNLVNMSFESNKIPTKFVEHLNECNLEVLQYFRLDRAEFDQRLLKSLAQDGKFKGGIDLLRTSIDDQGLSYLSELKTLDSIGIRGPNEKFTDTGLCDFIHSGISIKRVYLFHISLSDKAFGCLADLKSVEHFGFKRIKGRTASDMKKLEDLYFKKNGRKVIVDVFEYDSP